MILPTSCMISTRYVTHDPSLLDDRYKKQNSLPARKNYCIVTGIIYIKKKDLCLFKNIKLLISKALLEPWRKVLEIISLSSLTMATEGGSFLKPFFFFLPVSSVVIVVRVPVTLCTLFFFLMKVLHARPAL